MQPSDSSLQQALESIAVNADLLDRMVSTRECDDVFALISNARTGAGSAFKVQFTGEIEDTRRDSFSAHEKMAAHLLEKKILEGMNALLQEFSSHNAMQLPKMTLWVRVRRFPRKPLLLTLGLDGLQFTRARLDASALASKISTRLQKLAALRPEHLNGPYRQFLINKKTSIWAPSPEAAIVKAEVMGLSVFTIFEQLNTDALKQGLKEIPADAAEAASA